MVSLDRVGAHYAVSSLFSEYEDVERVYCYRVEREDYRLLTSGRARLALGRVRISSAITEESERFAFGALHLGDHNLSAGVIVDPDPARWKDLVEDLSEPFQSADLTEILRAPTAVRLRALRAAPAVPRRAAARARGDPSLRPLGGGRVVPDAVRGARSAPAVPRDAGNSAARGLKLAAELALATAVRHELEADEPDAARLSAVLEEARGAGIRLYEEGVGLAVEHSVERLAEALRAEPGDLARLEALERMVALARSLPFEVDFWKVQNAYYRMMKETLPESRRACDAGAEEACRYFERFVALGERLSVRVDENSGSPREAAAS
jgi:hypothetical protein